MKKIILMAFCLIASSSFAQKSSYVAPQMPVDEETKLITYSGVVDVPNTNKAELYKRCLGWFMATYKNPGEVIREKDSVGLKVVGKPRFRIYNEANDKGVKMDGGLVQYTLTVANRDNKYKYTFTEINWKQTSYFPIEKWVEQKDRFVQNNYYLYQTDSVARLDIIPSLEKAMKTVPKKSTKDEW